MALPEAGPLFDTTRAAVQGGPSAIHFNTFTGSPLDRLHEIRKQPSTLASLLESPDALFLPIFKRQPLICADKSRGCHFSAFLPRQGIAPASADFAEAILLGRVGSTTCYALPVTSAAPYETNIEQDNKQQHKFQDLRKSLPLLGAEDAAVLALATSLESWHSNTKYCARCGCRTILIEGGDKRQCSAGESKAQLEAIKATGEHLPQQARSSQASEQTIKDAQTSSPAPPPALSPKACGTSIYPRTDAVVIMCVESADRTRVLLGRKSVFPKGIYTCLAGFLGPAESIEEGVRRETFEESGVRVGDVRYFGSQPWPFGGQVMIGCHAVATSDEIVLRDQELEDAKWFTLNEVEAMIAHSLEATSFTTSEEVRIPPPLAIAHKLIASWYYSRTKSAL